MKIKNTLFSLFATLIFATSTQAVEKVVATVDGNPILESQVKRTLGKRANTEANRQIALDTLIDDLLVQKAIQESGVKVSPAQVDQTIHNIMVQNGLTFGKFLDALDYQGITLAQFRANIANQILMTEVRNHSIGKNIDVTREQVESLSHQMLEQAKKSGNQKQVTATEYNVRHILVKLNPLLNDAQAKAQLTQVRNDILAGKITFAEAAKNYSKDFLSGANGGSLGFSLPENYTPEFANTVKKTPKGQISAPFKTEFGWHILEVIDTRQGDITESAYRQKAYETLVNRQLQEDSKDWVKALRKSANIKILP